MATRTITRAGVGLVVGIILLAALVIGILFFVRERGEQARRTDAINIADQQLKEDSDKGIAANPESDNSSTKSDEQAPTVQTPAQPAPQSSSQTTPQTTPSTSTPNPSELPKTGPVDQLGEVAVLSMLTFSVVSYVVSRKRIY